MKRQKQSLIAFIVMLTFLVTSILPLPSVFASEDIDVSFSATMKGDNLEITVSGNDATKFVDSLEKVRVVDEVYFLPESGGKNIFLQKGNVITIKQSPSIFKDNLIELVSSTYGVKAFHFRNESGVGVADGLSIDSIISGEDGKIEVINGQEFGAVKKFVGFPLDYEYDNADGSMLFALTRKIEKVIFDGIEYPSLNERGETNFVLFEKILKAHEGFKETDQIFADFKKYSKHRVELIFDDGTSVSYQDEGYVEPNRNSEDVSPRPEEPEVSPSSTGIGQKYDFQKVIVNDASISIAIAPKPGVQINKVPGKDSDILYDLGDFETIEINGELFDSDSFSFSDNDNVIISDDLEVINAVKKANPVNLKLLVDRDNCLVGKVMSTTPNNGEENSASSNNMRKITEVELTTPMFGGAELSIIFNKPIDRNESKAFKDLVASVEVNGVSFGAEKFYVNYEGHYRASDEAIVNKAGEKKPISIKIVFKDGSVISKNTENSSATQEDLFANLSDGEYTLTYKTYKKKGNSYITSRENESVINTFFDERAKLKVENGKKTITLLNHTYANLVLDFAVRDDSAIKSATKKVIRIKKTGEDEAAEYSFEVSGFKEYVDAYVLGTGPMGGSRTEIGNYDSDSYKKVFLAFDKNITKGFTDFVANEKLQAKYKNNNKKLIHALSEQGFDPDGNLEITKEELYNGQGIKAQLIEGYEVPHVLNLEGLGLVDISLLEGLGPYIQHINLDGNDIETLPAGLLDKATGVKRIFLGGNNISEIPADFFKKLTKLTYLDLDGNSLTTLPEGVFSNNEKLEVLALMNNKLTSVPADLIKNAPKLKELYLYNNQNLANLPNDFFSSQKPAFLRCVELGYTGITHLPESLGDKKGLRQLNVEHSNLVDLPDLSGLSNVERVSFEGNYIHEFPIGLYKAMAKTAKNSSSSGLVKLDLSLNEINELPLEEMKASSDGAERMTLQVDRNYLKMPLSTQEEKEHEKLGISFQQNLDDNYYPQKGVSRFSATADHGVINLTSDFDILEMYYWYLGDMRGKGKFKKSADFLTYVQGEGRAINGVEKSLPRDEAIKKILESKGLEWKVSTKITKNDGIEVYSSERNNEKEGLTATFEDRVMKEGDRYTLTKVLYKKLNNNWISEMTIKTEFVAANSSTASEIRQVPVGLYERGGNTPSMANQTLKPQADLKEHDGKIYYTVYLKPMEVQGLRGEVVNFYYTKNGVKTSVSPENVAGEYPKAYTMEFNSEQSRVPVSFETNVNGLGEKQADLVFGELPKINTDKKTVKAYIISSKGDKMSMADKALIHEVTYIEDSDSYHFNIGFKPISLQGETAKVDKLFLKDNDTLVETSKVPTEEGHFTFTIPKEQVNKADDTKIPIAFALVPSVNGHDKPLEAKLLIDWNGDFEPITDNTVAPQPATASFNAYIMNKEKTALSMADKAFERKASYVDKEGWRTVSLYFKPLTIMGKQAKVNKIVYEAMGMTRVMTKDENREGVFSFKMPVFATAEEAGREIKVFFTLEPSVNGHDKPLEAILILDWNNSFTPPSVDNTPSNGGNSGHSADKTVHNVSVWAKKPDTNERSMADRSLRPSAKVVEENGTYTYIVGFKPITVAFGGKDVTGNIIELFAVSGGREEVMNEVGQDGDYKLYSIRLNEKVNTLPIRFDVDIMKDLGGGKKDAILILDWDGRNSAPSENAISGGGVPLTKNLEDEVSKIKEAIKLITPIEGYMKGYTDGSFKPNNTITRAESAVAFAKFVDLSKVKNQSKLIYVKKDAWYEDAMEKLYTLGLWEVQERSTKFALKPNDMITRAEVAQMIAGLKGLRATKTTKSFSDLKSTHWANNAIMACFEAGIISGYSDGSVKPDNKVTRAEFVLMMNRAFQKERKMIKQINYTDVKANHWAHEAIIIASN